MTSILQKQVRDVIKEVALECNLPIKSVTDMVMSQFEFVRDEVSSGDVTDPNTYKSVTLRYLGTFAFHKQMHTAIEYAKKGKRLKDEEHSRELQSEE